MTEIIVPSLGMSGMDVTITAWFKEEGDAVEKGEPLFEITTEKLNQEIESPESGILKKVCKKEGDTASVGELIAIIE